MTAHPALQTILRGQIAALASQPSGPERYFARVEAHVAYIPRAAQLAFLRAELGKWERRYQVFQRAVDRGDEIGTNASAFEYAETIAVLATRIAQLEQQVAA